MPQPNDTTPYIVKTKKEKDPIAVFVTKLKMSYGYQLYNYTESLLSDGSVNINFSAYNNRNVFAAIEVFDASGNVVDTQYIDSKTLNDSVSGALTDQAYSFVDGKTGFQDSLMSKQSDINLTVPKGGYVKISYNSNAAKIANLANQVVSLVLSLIEIDGKNSVASRQIKNYALDIAKGIFGDIASEATRGGVYSVADFYEKFKSTITTPENINKLSSALQSMVLAGNMNVKGKLLNKVNAWVVPAEMTVKALNIAAAVIAVKTDYSETDRRFTPSILR